MQWWSKWWSRIAATACLCAAPWSSFHLSLNVTVSASPVTREATCAQPHPTPASATSPAMSFARRERRCWATPASPPVPSPPNSVTPTRASLRTSTSVAKSLPPAPRRRSRRSDLQRPTMTRKTVGFEHRRTLSDGEVNSGSSAAAVIQYDACHTVVSRTAGAPRSLVENRATSHGQEEDSRPLQQRPSMNAQFAAEGADGLPYAGAHELLILGQAGDY